MRVLMQLSVCSLVMIVVTGCATKDSIIPNNGVPIEDVYFDNVSAKGEPVQTGEPSMVLKRRATMSELDLNPYIVRNTITPVYRMIDNPTLYIFSFPYLSDNGRVPVPGYVTEFKMFERDEYAQAGELNLNMGGK
ncbi:hypothetical protein UA38_11715 [Photobacterium kishitanii]|uniref:TIGR03751 family conjugal transfer lipoprotein n=1 Tax=Photobacterium kishitanii TaxID=318456 RepID=A0AAX0YSQ6_9GAMM|nr:hypothetical protein [Photobacterium kishitanii]KJG57035.1 hypothetical protein UA38_11715 [Photobacterium kishitanii]KJG60559.1 hypothetical protein UA42_14500 [Photobacterium kishitanii]KJG64861.1 hypothetical protein UA40_14195 [Photobacterium kishitanii]KJG68498.1 hypothetical protein UA41_16610 [Photobacterium kishitanii]OBU31218.1 hypothetical protein AYY23_20105 [Photobacterium kishitanii]